MHGVLLIPTRIQTRIGSPEFKRWRHALELSVLDQIAQTPLFHDELLALTLKIYYPYSGAISADKLAEQRIPRITAAAEAVLIALTDLLYRRRNQIQQLIIYRLMSEPDALAAEYGDVWRSGGLCVEYAVL